MDILEKMRREQCVAAILKLEGHPDEAADREENVRWMMELKNYKKNSETVKAKVMLACEDATSYMEPKQGKVFVEKIKNILEEL